jgi:hypothetical protein
VRSIFLVLTTFIINSFWLLPVLYFSVTNPALLTESKINTFSTPEMQEFNNATANIYDVVRLKGFWFSYTDVGSEGKYTYLMQPWRDYFAVNPIFEISAIITILSLVGLIFGIVQRNNSWRFSGAILVLVSYFMLFSYRGPTGDIYSFLSKNVPLFEAAFRSVFTKWSIPLVTALSIGLGLFISAVGKFTKKLFLIVPAALTAILIVMNIWLVLPAYQGNFIYPRLRINIPNEYFNLFNFFKGESKQSRIAFFPIQTFYGWNFYDWTNSQPSNKSTINGVYRGSGFIWYGIEQPILDRAFDVWSSKNENFYDEISTAFYNDDKDTVLSVYKKYDVSYVVVDKNVVLPQQNDKLLGFDKISTIFKEADASVVFQNGQLTVYKLPWATSSFVATKTDLKELGPVTDGVTTDAIYTSQGSYISDNDQAVNNYPLNYLYKEELKDINYSDTNDSGTWITLPFKVENQSELSIPAMHLGKEYSVPALAKFDGKKLTVTFSPAVQFLPDNNQLLQTLPELTISTTKDINQAWVVINQNKFPINKNEEKEISLQLYSGAPVTLELFDAEHKVNYFLGDDFIKSEFPVCWEREGTDGLINIQHYDRYSSLTVKDKAGCYSGKIGDLNGVNLVKVVLAYRSHNGSRPHFCVVKEGEFNCYNDEVFYSSTPEDNQWMAVERMMVLPPNKYWVSVAARPPDVIGAAWNIDYMAPSIESYPMIVHKVVDSTFWNSLTHIQKVELTKVNAIRLFAHKINVDLVRSGQSDPKDCDIFTRGIISKTTLNPEVVYKAANESSICDYIPLTYLTTDNSYLFRVTGVNKEGRGMKIYLYNKAQEKDTLEILLKGNNFDTTLAIPATNKIAANDHVINFEVRSFGEPAESTLSQVSYYQLPLDWLSQWNIKSNQNGELIASSGQVSTLNKSGTYSYLVNTRFPDDKGVVILSQGYDKSWKAYVTGNKLAQIIPFFSPTLPHYYYNSWANAWSVDKGDNTITIIYLPQYLEFLGFALGIVSIVGLGIIGVWKRNLK